MYNRMVVAVSDVEEKGSKCKFALVLERFHPDGPVNNELICTCDTYALADYWATMYNIGSADVDRIKEALSKGFEGVPQGADARQEYLEGRYGGIAPEAGAKPLPQPPEEDGNGSE